MIIDCHMHINHNGLKLENFKKYLDKHRIEQCWLLTWDEIDPKLPYNNFRIEDVYNAYLKYPSRVIPMYAPDPNRENAPSLLEQWCQKGIKGCAELKTTLNWRSKKINKLLSKAQDLKIPILFHMEEKFDYYASLATDGNLNIFFLRLFKSTKLLHLNEIFFKLLTRYCNTARKWINERTFHFPGYLLDFSTLESILKTYQSINFIGHGPLFWRMISADESLVYGAKMPIKMEGLMVKMLRNYPNLYGDISAASGYYALDRDHEFAKQFLSELSKKILYGSDNAGMNHLGLLKSLSISKRDLSMILWENSYSLINDY